MSSNNKTNNKSNNKTIATMGTKRNQSVTFVSHVFRAEVGFSANPYYENTFEIGGRRLNFDSLFPEEDLRNKDFSMYIYEGVRSFVEIHLGNELKYGVFNATEFGTPGTICVEKI